MTFRSFLKWQIVLLIGLTICFFSSFGRAVAPEAKPVMEIASPRYDAGSHWEGEVISHVFEVRNSGKGELKIFNVKPG
jgi:hypothetical protein